MRAQCLNGGPKGGVSSRNVRFPLSPNSLVVMQFSAKKLCQIIGWRSPYWIGDPSPENQGSSTNLDILTLSIK